MIVRLVIKYDFFSIFDVGKLIFILFIFFYK